MFNLMRRFRAKWYEIPEHVRIFQMSLGVPLLCVDERWELGREKKKRNFLSQEICSTNWLADCPGYIM